MKEWLLAVIVGLLLVAALSLPGCTIPACPDCPPVDTFEIVEAIEAIDVSLILPYCPDCPDMDCPDIDYPAYERTLESADVYSIIRTYWTNTGIGWTIKSITPTYLSNGIWKTKVTFTGSSAIRYFYFNEITGYIR